MPKGGKRRAIQSRRSEHIDKYAGFAAKARAELEAFNAKWERDHPVTEAQMTAEIPDEEEAA